MCVCVASHREKERERRVSLLRWHTFATNRLLSRTSRPFLSLSHPVRTLRRGSRVDFFFQPCLSLYLRTSCPRVLLSYDKYIYTRFRRYIDRSRSFAIILTFALPSFAPLSERRNVINKFSRWRAQRRRKREREEKDAATSSPIPSRLHYIARTNLIATDIKYYRCTKRGSWPRILRCTNEPYSDHLVPRMDFNRSTFDIQISTPQ